METIKESLKEDIKRLALCNLDKEPILIHEKEKLEELYDEIKKVTDEYKLIRQQYGKKIFKKNKLYQKNFFFLLEEKTGETNPEMLWVLLQTAASELERSTEVFSSLYLN